MIEVKASEASNKSGKGGNFKKKEERRKITEENIKWKRKDKILLEKSRSNSRSIRLLEKSSGKWRENLWSQIEINNRCNKLMKFYTKTLL